MPRDHRHRGHQHHHRPPASWADEFGLVVGETYPPMHNILLVSDRAGLARVRAALTRTKLVAMDCEGRDLGTPSGTLDLVSIAIPAEHSVYIVDVALASDPQAARQLLAEVLANPALTKLFYDVRADMEAFRTELNINVFAGIVDVQVLACLQRRAPGRVQFRPMSRPGLAKQFRFLVREAPEEHGDVKKTIHDTDHDIWCQRPLSEEALQYAGADVHYLVPLFVRLVRRREMRHSDIRNIVLEETARQVVAFKDAAIEAPWLAPSFANLRTVSNTELCSECRLLLPTVLFDDDELRKREGVCAACRRIADDALREAEH